MLILNRPWDTNPPAGTTFGPLGDRLQMFFAGDYARDASGRMGTVVGGSWVASRFGQVRKQDRNEYVDSAATYNTVGSNAPITIAAWVNPANSDVAVDYVISLGNTSSGQLALGVNGTNAGSAYLIVGSSGEIYTAAGVVLNNAWNSVVFVFSGGGNPSSTTAAVYVNGVKQSLTFASMSALSVTAALTARLYSAKFAGERHFRGMVGPVGVWSRAIDSDEVMQWHANPWQVFAPQPLYIPVSVSGGGGSQTLLPDLYSNTQTFYAPTVTPGTVDLTPSLYNNTAIFYAPTVSTGTVSLAPTLYSNSQVFYSATITQGSVLEPSLYSNTQSFYPPSVTRGGVVLTPALFTNSGSFYAATVTNGAQALTPTRVNNSQTFYIPTISVGSVTLVPTLFNNTNVFYAASVSDGTTSSATIKAGSWIRYRIIT